MPDTITTAVPQQAPPANAIQHPAKVYLLSRRLPDIVHLVQYDQTLPVLAVELLQGDAPYTVPEGAAVNIRMAKPVPSSKKVYNPAYGISEDRHTVYIAVTPQMTVVAGCTNPVIEVVVDGGVACTGTLRLEIDPNPVQETDIIDSDEYKTIAQMIADAEEAAKAAADAASQASKSSSAAASSATAASKSQSAAAASAEDSKSSATAAANSQNAASKSATAAAASQSDAAKSKQAAAESETAAAASAAEARRYANQAAGDRELSFWVDDTDGGLNCTIQDKSEASAAAAQEGA